LDLAAHIKIYPQQTKVDIHKNQEYAVTCSDERPQK
jgi:hypothetical protein